MNGVVTLGSASLWWYPHTLKSLMVEVVVICDLVALPDVARNVNASPGFTSIVSSLTHAVSARADSATNKNFFFIVLFVLRMKQSVYLAHMMMSCSSSIHSSTSGWKPLSSPIGSGSVSLSMMICTRLGLGAWSTWSVTSKV